LQTSEEKYYNYGTNSYCDYVILPNLVEVFQCSKLTIFNNKVIQYPENHKEHPKEVQNQQNEPIDESVEKGDPKTTNTVPFPPIPDLTVEAENVDEDIQQYGRGHRPRKQQGAYRDMNEGLTAAMAHCEDLIEDENFSVGAENEIGGSLDDLPPDFALVGSIGSDP